MATTIKDLVSRIIDTTKIDLTGIQAIDHWVVLVEDDQGRVKPVESTEWNADAKALILRVG